MRILRPGDRYVVGFHASNADVSYFDAIAEALPPTWGTAAVSSRWLALDDVPEELPELAALYRAQLADALGGADLVLGGWGFGGLIALACAQVVSQRAPRALFAIETKIPEPGWENRPTELATMARILAEHRAKWAELPAPTVPPDGEPLDRYMRGLASVGLDATVDDANHELQLFRRHVRGVTRYRPAPTTLPCALVYTIPAHELGWAPLAPHASVHGVPGDHFTIARAANRPAIARIVGELLDGVDSSE